MEKRGIRSRSKGICTHLSSVRLIRILPSVENTIKDIRNCGLGQGRKYSRLALWPVLMNVFPQCIFLSLPYKFMSEMFNKLVDFSPVMLHTARSERRKARQRWEEARINNKHDALVLCLAMCFGHSYTFLSRVCAPRTKLFIVSTVHFVSLQLAHDSHKRRSLTPALTDFQSGKWRKWRVCWIVLPPVKVFFCCAAQMVYDEACQWCWTPQVALNIAVPHLQWSKSYWSQMFRFNHLWSPKVSVIKKKILPGRVLGQSLLRSNVNICLQS